MSEQVFISYRRDGGDTTAGLICTRLKEKGFSVFYDFDSLGGGCFDDRIFEAIEGCRDFVLVLSVHCLDRCTHEDDWVRKEIRLALQSKKNIIPVMLPGFTFPDELPDDIAEISRHNAVPLVMAYLDAVIDSIVARFSEKANNKKSAASIPAENRTASLIKRVFLFLEDGNFASADKYCEKVLDIDPECAEAYLGKLMIALKVKTQEELKNAPLPFDDDANYKKILRFGSAELKSTLSGYIDHIGKRNEEARLTDAYNLAANKLRIASTAEEYGECAALFCELGDFKDSATLAKQCEQKATQITEAYWRNKYMRTVADMKKAKTVDDLRAVAARFQKFGNYQNAVAFSAQCIEKANKLTKRFRISMLVGSTVLVLTVLLLIFLLPTIRYETAMNLMEAGEYQAAAEMFQKADDYKDAIAKKMHCYELSGNFKPVISYYGYTEYTIPDGVTSIPPFAFSGCEGLTSVTIPDSVTIIDNYAFSRCTNLTSITIPDSVTCIGEGAFSGCTSLSSITIPFVGMTKDGTDNTHFGYIFGIATCWSHSRLIPSSLKTVVITGGTRIDENAFCYCKSIESVTIPSSVTSIGSCAFYDCDNLTSIYYVGTSKSWEKITKGALWNEPTFPTIHIKY